MPESSRSGQPPIELRQSTASTLQVPILIAIVLLAVVLTVEGSQSTVVYLVCAGVAVLDLIFLRYLLRNTRPTLVITTDDITLTKRHGPNDKAAPPQEVTDRVPGSSLSFQVAANGPGGSKDTRYVLMLRDNAIGPKCTLTLLAAGRSSRSASPKGGRSTETPRIRGVCNQFGRPQASLGRLHARTQNSSQCSAGRSSFRTWSPSRPAFENACGMLAYTR